MQESQRAQLRSLFKTLSQGRDDSDKVLKALLRLYEGSVKAQGRDDSDEHLSQHAGNAQAVHTSEHTPPEYTRHSNTLPTRPPPSSPPASSCHTGHHRAPAVARNTEAERGDGLGRGGQDAAEGGGRQCGVEGGRGMSAARSCRVALSLLPCCRYSTS